MADHGEGAGFWSVNAATGRERLLFLPQGRNEPGQLPRIAQVLADLRGIAVEDLPCACRRNAIEVLPRLARLLPAETPDGALP